MEEREFINVAKEISPSHYFDLGNSFGFGFAELNSIRQKQFMDNIASLVEVFTRWKIDQDEQNMRSTFAEKLSESNLEGIADAFIKDATATNKQKLQQLKRVASRNVELGQKRLDKLSSCEEEAKQHLTSIKGELNVTMDQEKDKELQNVSVALPHGNENSISKSKVNQTYIDGHDTSDDVERINQERHIIPRQKQRNMSDLIKEVNSISDMVQSKIDAMKRKITKEDNRVLEEVSNKIDALLEDEKKVTNARTAGISSMEETLAKIEDESAMEQLLSRVRSVRFIEGAGRLVGCSSRWELVDVFEFEEKIKFPRILGCLNDEELVVGDRKKGNRCIFVINLHKNIQKAYSLDSHIASCVLLNEDTIVCGMWQYRSPPNGEEATREGYINTYSREWQLQKSFKMPSDPGNSWFDVDVDQEGFIVAIDWGHSQIFTIDPVDGRILKEKKRVDHLILLGVLGSGEIVAQPYPANKRLLIIDRKGGDTAIVHHEKVLNCVIDPLTSDVYLVFQTEPGTGELYRIPRVKDSYEVKPEEARSVSFRLRPVWEGDERCLLSYSRFLMTSSGKIIFCDGRNFLILKKNIYI